VGRCETTDPNEHVPSGVGGSAALVTMRTTATTRPPLPLPRMIAWINIGGKNSLAYVHSADHRMAAPVPDLDDVRP
jgi:hypothetical protein